MTARTARRRTRGSSTGWAWVVLLAVLALFVYALGLIAIVVVPLVVVAALVIAVDPRHIGSRIRAWHLWSRIPGFRSRTTAPGFALVLLLYGVPLPAIGFAIVHAPQFTAPASPVQSSDATSGPTDSAGATATVVAGAATEAPASPTAPLATDAPTAAPATPMPAPGAGSLPDPRLTPGESLAGVTAANVCTSGWAGRHRHVTLQQYAEVYAEYGVRYPEPSGTYELDHLIPLELGGDNANANLWPERASPAPGFHQKDALENAMHDMVCSGSKSLAEAQHEIASDWYAAYVRYVGA